MHTAAVLALLRPLAHLDSHLLLNLAHLGQQADVYLVGVEGNHLPTRRPFLDVDFLRAHEQARVPAGDVGHFRVCRAGCNNPA